MASISVVIPAFNEAHRIAASVAAVRNQPGFCEVIVSVGESWDNTASLAETAGATIVHGEKGRAAQMNAGAAVATGDVLLFLHADVTLPHGAAIHIHNTLKPNGVVAGAFKTWTYNDPAASGSWRFGALVHIADVRSRVSVTPYGDHALFVPTTCFNAVGGFPEVPLMEDIAMAKRLRQIGRIGRAPASVQVSARRWQERPLRTILTMVSFPLAYRLGVSPKRLSNLYAAIR